MGKGVSKSDPGYIKLLPCVFMAEPRWCNSVPGVAPRPDPTAPNTPATSGVAIASRCSHLCDKGGARLRALARTALRLPGAAGSPVTPVATV